MAARRNEMKIFPHMYVHYDDNDDDDDGSAVDNTPVSDAYSAFLEIQSGRRAAPGGGACLFSPRGCSCHCAAYACKVAETGDFGRKRTALAYARNILCI